MTTSRPPNPYLVLLSAVLPGVGHFVLGLTQRALTFLFFMVILGWVTLRVAPPEASFIGRHAGGVFIYSLSILDAYKIARINFEKWRHASTQNSGGAS
jgi:hypothetical protein